jgi:chemosensory pili system protein ChpC
MSQGSTKEVRSVLIPLHQHDLLLPNAAVAEVTGFQKPEPADGNMPEWFLGYIAWRGIMVPVVSYEGLLGEPVVLPGYRGRILILNTLREHERFSHIGLVVQAIPSLVRVSSENINPASTKDEDASQALIKQPVEVDMSPAVIPDLDEMERRIFDLIAQH